MTEVCQGADAKIAAHPQGFVVVIPVKPAVVGKSRLQVPGVVREALARAIALDTVLAAAAATLVAEVLVVTQDALTAEYLAEVPKVRVLADTANNLNGAIDLGVQFAGLQANRAVLLGDLPAMKPAELDFALQAGLGYQRAFVPDAEETGTALVTAQAGVPLHTEFGRDSAHRHETAGFTLVAIPADWGLRRDLDEADHLPAAVACGLGARTAAVLAKRRVTAQAPGKINLYLGVGGLDSSGYHPLATIFLAVSLTETVTATAAETWQIRVDGPGADSVPEDETNLAMRAARLLAQQCGISAGVHLEITKQVPVAGGMAGGSADAAAALVACNQLWQTGLTAEQLHELAAQLGADVPFVLQGGTALGTGRGDVLTPVQTDANLHWVIIPASGGLSTPRVFAQFDEVQARMPVSERATMPPEVPAALIAALAGGDASAIAAELRNDLSNAALELRPDLAQTMAAAAQAGALRGIISGSGPTVALLCANRVSAGQVSQRMIAQGYAALLAEGPVTGAQVVSG